MAHSIADALGDSDITNDVDFFALCERIRRIGREGALQLSYLADELRGLIAEMPDHPDAAHSSKKRAALIAGHVQNAADAFNEAAVCGARAQSSFKRHMAPELESAYGATRPKPRKASFKVGDK